MDQEQLMQFPGDDGGCLLCAAIIVVHEDTFYMEAVRHDPEDQQVFIRALGIGEIMTLDNGEILSPDKDLLLNPQQAVPE